MTTEQGAPEAGAWKTVPRKPARAMALSAAVAHYGKKRVAACGGIDGISMTVDGIDYNFWQAFKRFWKGAIAASPSPPPVGVGKPDFWAVHSHTGMHIGLWPDKADAEKVLREYDGGAITPLFRAPPVGGEVVKLTWRGDFAHTDFGLFYYVNHATGQPGCVVLEKHEGASTLKSAWVTVDDAKAAAQADFERRIRSALVPSSPSMLEEVGEALRPFASVAPTFSWAIGPDGIDDHLAVVAYVHVKRGQEVVLSTADFSNAARVFAKLGVSS